MARDEERRRRAQQEPIVGGLPEAGGIGAAMRLTPGLGTHLRGLADELLVNDFPGATLRRDQRETLAAAVSAANDCFFCMDTHKAFATAVMEREGNSELAPLLDEVLRGSSEGFDAKMRALLLISRTVRADPLALTAADVEAAHDAGASEGDVQLAVLIAAAFSMYNRMVDGLRARTSPDPAAYEGRAAEIAANGYSAPSGMQATAPATASASATEPPRG
jgi:AhpD family alkylhydroperoxidase